MRIIVFLILFVVSSFANNYSKQELEKMIAKMVILGFYGTKIDANSQIAKDIKSGLGGVILFDMDPTNKDKAKNIESRDQLKKLNETLQSFRKEKLLISIDQEGGAVQRLKPKHGFTNTLSANEIAKNGDEFARSSYDTLAKELKYSGINLNFAPSVDLAINPKNKVIVTRGRSFSKDEKIVTKYAKIFIEQMNKEGVLTSLKHFPGHGSSLADSHLGFVDISNTWSKIELEPYKNLIKSKSVDLIMTAHVFNKNIDSKYPATLSYATNSKLLREKLGFDGVLITDDLQMSAISKHYDLKQTVSLAINSGVNILLFANQLAKPLSLKEIVDTVYSELQNGNIKVERIIDSNKKIDKLLEKI